LVIFEDTGVTKRQADIKMFVNEILMLSIIHTISNDK
jgi:hypothetical protein